MNGNRFAALFLILPLIAASCAGNPAPADPAPAADMPNPASEYCLSQGFALQIITAPDGSQSGLCVFDDGSSCDEWAYFRGECAPTGEAAGENMETEQVQTPTSGSGETGALPTIDPDEYQGWWTYTHPQAGFSLMLPEDWTVREETGSSTLSGHLITLHPDPALDGYIWVTFRQAGEEILLWPTGVGQGEFVPQGTLQIGGVEVRRGTLVCPTGEVTSIYYQGMGESPSITLGGLEFGLIYFASPNHCQPGVTLDGKNLRVGEMILASLTVP